MNKRPNGLTPITIAAKLYKVKNQRVNVEIQVYIQRVNVQRALDSIKVYIEAIMIYLNKFNGVNIGCHYHYEEYEAILV